MQRKFFTSRPHQIIVPLIQSGQREHIPDDLGAELGQLIRSCWDTDPWKRPSLEEILGVLDQQLALQPAVEQSPSRNRLVLTS